MVILKKFAIPGMLLVLLALFFCATRILKQTVDSAVIEGRGGTKDDGYGSENTFWICMINVKR